MSKTIFMAAPSDPIAETISAGLQLAAGRWPAEYRDDFNLLWLQARCMDKGLYNRRAMLPILLAMNEPIWARLDSLLGEGTAEGMRGVFEQLAATPPVKFGQLWPGFGRLFILMATQIDGEGFLAALETARSGGLSHFRQMIDAAKRTMRADLPAAITNLAGGEL
jgi:hypothetical protein